MAANPGTISLDLAIRPLIPHLDQYFGLWAMERDLFVRLSESVRLMDLQAHVAGTLAAARGADTSERDYQVTAGGVAVIPIMGTMMKYGSSLGDGGSTVMARRRIRAAARDEAVKSIMLLIDSPGGSVAGTSDLADEVLKAKAAKPVTAYIEDMGASAAYWVASQADAIYANQTANVGSIGVFGVVHDMSIRAAQEGIKVMVFRSGPYKGAGTPGEAITDEQRDEFQRHVDELFGVFTKAVMNGRGMTRSEVDAVADGRVWMASDAKGLKLIDGVKSFDEALVATSRMRPSATSGAVKSEQEEMPTMAEDNTSDQPRPATIQELKAACAGADADWLMAQLEANATIGQAQGAWIAEQHRRIDASEKARAEAEAKRIEAEEKAARAAQSPGVEPVSDSADATAGPSDPIGDWNAEIAKKTAMGMDRKRATLAVGRENPRLHEAYIAAYNAANQSPRRRVD